MPVAKKVDRSPHLGKEWVLVPSCNSVSNETIVSSERMQLQHGQFVLLFNWTKYKWPVVILNLPIADLIEDVRC